MYLRFLKIGTNTGGRKYSDNRRPKSNRIRSFEWNFTINCTLLNTQQHIYTVHAVSFLLPWRRGLRNHTYNDLQLLHPYFRLSWFWFLRSTKLEKLHPFLNTLRMRRTGTTPTRIEVVALVPISLPQWFITAATFSGFSNYRLKTLLKDKART